MTSPALIDVEILHVTDCPNVVLARERLADAAARAGVEIAVQERLVTEEADARRLCMRGSPTVLVRGEDVSPSDVDPGSLSCRLYRTDAGLEGAPCVDVLVEALRP